MNRIQHLILPDGAAEMLQLADCVAVPNASQTAWTVGDRYGELVIIPSRIEILGWTSSDFALAIQELLRRQARNGSKPLFEIKHR